MGGSESMERTVFNLLPPPPPPCTKLFVELKRRFAAVSMNFQNLYDFAQIWWRHSLIHFLSDMQKKLGVTMLVFKMALTKVPLIASTFSLGFFLLTLLVGRHAINLWVCSNIWANTTFVPEKILRAFLLSSSFYRYKKPILYLAAWGKMVKPELIWGRCAYMIFIKFQKMSMGISFEKMRKNWGSLCWLRSGRPNCKLPSQLRKIVKHHLLVTCVAFFNFFSIGEITLKG